MYRPEFLKEGQTILFREGKTKGLGIITKVIKGEAPK
jgi:GTPase